MKFIKHIFLLLAIIVTVPSFGQNFPPKANPPKLVNDFLHILTAEQEQTLEQKLVDFDKRTSTQIAIVTTDDIGGMDAGDYAVELGKKWGVGNANFNNGIVFLIYRSKDNTKRKVFIATGTGLEGVLPDFTCSAIIDNEVRPYLKEQDFYQALDKGTTAIINATEGKYTAPAGYGKTKAPSLFKTLMIIFLIIIFLSVISKGGGGGSYMSRRGYRGFGGPPIWWSGGGGSGWGGGGSSGGSGGFGGFGGGGFGGGGAGGDW